jgi:hypothetical protein
MRIIAGKIMLRPEAPESRLFKYLKVMLDE